MLRLFTKSLRTGILTTDYPDEPDVPVSGFQGMPVWQEACCQRCGDCALVCPMEAIKLDRNAPAASFWSVDSKKCIFCGYCADDCPGRALGHGHRYDLAERAGEAEEFLKGSDSKIFGRSAHIRHLDAGSCNGCDWEMTALTGPIYDIQRFGFDFVASPRHADILMVTGPVTRNLEIAALKTFQATPAPKKVVAVGTCACSGGICGKSYASAGGVNNILLVDVYIPGCPPRPQALIQGLRRAVNR
ncbi:MAG: NADH-quinone oxidoreductase subunit B family protein [Bacillota bacterium]